MSLHDRARQAAREERARQAHLGPTADQALAAGVLSQILECEVDPLDLTVSAIDGGVNVAYTTTVDDMRVRVVYHEDAPIFEAEIGRGALKRWMPFESLAELGKHLD